MSNLEDRLNEANKQQAEKGIWTPGTYQTERELQQQLDGAQLGYMVGSFWALSTGKWGKRINKYAPVSILVMFTIACAIASVR